MKRLKNIFSILTVVLFVSYYASSSMFYHTHHFEWGSVTHSHPFMPQAAHSHTAASCSMIEALGSALFLATTLSLVVALFASTYRYTVKDLPLTVKCRQRFSSLRAPPVC